MNEENKILCCVIAEMAVNCGYDLTGDHRKNYNFRILKALDCLVKIYPLEMGKALAEAKLFE